MGDLRQTMKQYIFDHQEKCRVSKCCVSVFHTTIVFPLASGVYEVDRVAGDYARKMPSNEQSPKKRIPPRAGSEKKVDRVNVHVQDSFNCSPPRRRPGTRRILEQDKRAGEYAVVRRTR